MNYEEHRYPFRQDNFKMCSLYYLVCYYDSIYIKIVVKLRGKLKNCVKTNLTVETIILIVH